MSQGTKISWTSATWNPTTGCDQVSPGCDHCYALTLAARLKRMGNPRYQHDGSPKTSGPGFALTLHPDKIEEPMKWKKPRHVFVNSMSDLFHDDVPREFIAKVFAVMALARSHTFQVLTKRPRRMMGLLNETGPRSFRTLVTVEQARQKWGATQELHPSTVWPLPNVWMGTSVEDQKRADLRIPLLLETPAAVRFLSCEPLLGPVDLSTYLGVEYMDTLEGYGQEMFAALNGQVGGGLHWIIVGGESGPDFRSMNLDWARTVRDQAVAAEVPFFYKQGSGPRSEMHKELDGRTWDEMPEHVG